MASRPSTTTPAVGAAGSRGVDRAHASDRGETTLVIARLVADLAAIGAAIGLAFALRFGLGVLQVARDVPLDLPGHAIASVLWGVAVVSIMAAQRLYDEDTLASPRGETARIRTSVIEGVAIVATAVFLLHMIAVSRGWFVLVAALSFLLLVVERRLARGLVARTRARGRLRRPVVLVGGTGPEPASDEFEVIARLTAEELGPYLDSVVHGRAGRWRSVPGILLQADTRPSEDVWELVVQAGGAGFPVYVASPVRSVATDRLTTRELDGRTIVKVSPPALIGIHAFEKRVYDLTVSAFLLVILALPMLFVALAILVTSGRPVLYRQERVGRAGSVFRMWKFRTMEEDAERDTGPVWAVKADPRRTRLGRILRTSSLDELPQLWNVLVGDMSIVGPRPERPPFVEEFNESVAAYRHRHRIRPGITGLAQVTGLRGDTELGPRVDADNRYIEHWSLMLDVGITLRTVVEVLRGRNAG